MSVIGLKLRATITKYNGDGTVTVKVDETSDITQDINTHSVGLPIAFSSPNGAFIGGCPAENTPVMIEQAQGEWFVSGFVKSDDIYNNNNTFGTGGILGNLMSDLEQGRLLFQTENASNRIYLDPSEGIVSGDSNSQTHEDPNQSIISHTFDSYWNFTKAHRSITGPIKRDPTWQLNVSGNTLYDHTYEPDWTVGMDPTTNVSSTTSGVNYRNLPLVESRSIYYELYDGDNRSSFENDRSESDKYNPEFDQKSREEKSRIQNRTNAFGLNLHYPNHLIEDIKGTGVDVYGNIIDINRSILPLGEGDLSLSDNEDNIDAFKKIRANHRKSLAYHFEINARKDLNNDDVFEVSPASDNSNHSRDRSTFFFDIDKEGQFKINVPSSSEIGNIPLPTRYVNGSVLAYEAELTNSPNTLFEEEDGVDIYLESFSNNKDNDDGVSLIENNNQTGPQDRFFEKPIKLNTPFHSITNAGYYFTEAWKDGLGGDQNLVPYAPNASVNRDGVQVEKVISDEIIVGGDNANAGGRSGAINMDGFLSMSLGANTVDRQSLWFDTAGGLVSMIGRDRRGISHSATLDGDMIMSIGGPGIGSSSDDRFSEENNGNRSGALDIRVIRNDGQMTIVRIDELGVSISTPGRLEINAQQDLTLRSNTQIAMEAPNIIAYHETMPRVIKRTGVPEI